MKRTAAVLAALALSLAGCSAETPSSSPGPSTSAGSAAGTASADVALPAEVTDLLASAGVQATDVKGAISALDQLDQRRPLALNGSVRADQVIFIADGQELAVPIPGDEVYVSIAPFHQQTHDCFYHALGSCQGELTGQDVHVTITDEAGEVLVDEDATTYANGFVGFWLPKGRTGTIAVTQGELSGEVAFDTGPEGATCITTLQLR